MYMLKQGLDILKFIVNIILNVKDELYRVHSCQGSQGGQGKVRYFRDYQGKSGKMFKKRF